MFRICFSFFLLFFFLRSNAQFAPAAGVPGSTAIFKDSSIIVNWATGCEITRGLAQINLPDSGYATVGDASSAVGRAGENGVVSLGDGGSATLTFELPVINGNGFDFCVFENSFLDTFLELAFVEVSSDGNYFVRFPAASHTQDTLQVGPFDYLQPTQIHNLAGKYRALYGTPFDLDELKDSAGIDVNSITHVRLVDVVGSLVENLARYDAYGKKINDPFPTPFPSSGFDLDAVGVIHQSAASVGSVTAQMVSAVPNPFYHQFTVSGLSGSNTIRLTDLTGRVFYNERIDSSAVIISTTTFPAGVFLLQVEDSIGIVRNIKLVH